MEEADISVGNPTVAVDKEYYSLSTKKVYGGTPPVALPVVEEWHYFTFAKDLIKYTLIIMGVASVIAVACPSRGHIAFSLIQLFLYPFLTLMIGYVFGKGFPINKK